MNIFIVYILKCSDNSYYVGMTSNFDQRLHEHNSGSFPEAYTFKRRPVELQWVEEFTDPNIALDVEKQIKGWSRRKKEALIQRDWNKLIELSRNYTQFGRAKED